MLLSEKFQYEKATYHRFQLHGILEKENKTKETIKDQFGGNVEENEGSTSSYFSEKNRCKQINRMP